MDVGEHHKWGGISGRYREFQKGTEDLTTSPAYLLGVLHLYTFNKYLLNTEDKIVNKMNKLLALMELTFQYEKQS